MFTGKIALRMRGMTSSVYWGEMKLFRLDELGTCTCTCDQALVAKRIFCALKMHMIMICMFY